ncbi:MAG: MBL fold metallo-hydrolase [Methanocalculus sp. MSAO_Arc2]|uniref:MBL fold metallo-hydrolase n=1 Tax=Methanocalculus sp. MSAO_Arc2 TaxID=2293855 RepID=UPI000FF6429C|nr:MAG: MBL fold metallo-hydrolase [Methanocalculus sp. MSAO_Arc2]
MERKYSFIARMPDEPGSLLKAADIIRRHDGNINRIQFDRRIDKNTVFFEMTATEEKYHQIRDGLHAIGYLQSQIPPINILLFHIYLPTPHRPGALYEVLSACAQAGADVAEIDFDDTGQHPDRLTIRLNVVDSPRIEEVINAIKSRYRLEILEYDPLGEALDETIFYITFAQKIRPFLGEANDDFLLSFLGDINHVVQELTNRGEDPKAVFDSIVRIGTFLRGTTGSGFSADYQQISIQNGVSLTCIQPPGGGSIFIFEADGERMQIDSGYGIYHADIERMLHTIGLFGFDGIGRIICTHADADHCGAAGRISAPCSLHPGTDAIIECNNRGYGSRSEGLILESVYTVMINLFSECTPPQERVLFPTVPIGYRGIFPIIDTFTIQNHRFEVLESLGGHIHGQVFLLAPDLGLLFTGDSLINFSSLTEEHRQYNSIADFLVTSVNVDSDIARQERRELVRLADECDRKMQKNGRRCLICGGHGAVSTLENGGLAAYKEIRHYRHSA